MRRKPVPPAPGSLDRVEAVRAAVPRDAGSVEDCCARLIRHAEVPDRQAASDWLAFLASLGLAEEVDRTFARTDAPAARDDIATAFRDGVYGVREVLSVLDDADDPLPAPDVFERFRDRGAIPRGDRQREGYEETWRERVGQILDWAVLLGLVDRVDPGYVAARER